ncbi:nucleotidyltransferase domain-containing protein [Paracidovorax wautersii]|uniref:Nucleotidyltransferase n=1 Tax=Paracidovorax wautersii TaxID=1177982 RepID=A0A1I2H6S9_9BURK|nr:nucleotidyltransferase [Paracidovorax wautersii]SFF24331.1 hypothetical protein SAMN04489711_11928 [Paracidovorax wautersii]
MKRDPAIAIAPPSRSPTFATRFFYLVDVIAKAHEPTASQLEALDSSYESTGNFLCEQPEFAGLLTTVHSHGSRHLGTIVRPRDGGRQGFDVDLIASFETDAFLAYDLPHGPGKLLDQLERCMDRYARAHRLEIKRYSRCITINYEGGMTADIAPVIDSPLQAAPYGDTHGLIPDHEFHQYEPTNPRGYSRYFKEAATISPVYFTEFVIAMESIREAAVEPLPQADEVLGQLLSRLVQLVKLHRNTTFGPPTADADDLAPSSVFLTTLVAEAYKFQAPIPHASPLSLLLDIVVDMPNRFTRAGSDGASRWHLANPAVPHGNLAEDMNSPPKQEAFEKWHRMFEMDLRAIVQSIEQPEGFDQLCKHVEKAFGKRASEAVSEDATKLQESRRSAQTVGIFEPVVTRAAASGAASTSIASSARVIPSRPHTFFGS